MSKNQNSKNGSNQQPLQVSFVDPSTALQKAPSLLEPKNNQLMTLNNATQNNLLHNNRYSTLKEIEQVGYPLYQQRNINPLKSKDGSPNAGINVGGGQQFLTLDAAKPLQQSTLSPNLYVKQNRALPPVSPNPRDSISKEKSTSTPLGTLDQPKKAPSFTNKNLRTIQQAPTELLFGGKSSSPSVPAHPQQQSGRHYNIQNTRNVPESQTLNPLINPPKLQQMIINQQDLPAPSLAQLAAGAGQVVGSQNQSDLVDQLMTTNASSPPKLPTKLRHLNSMLMMKKQSQKRNLPLSKSVQHQHGNNNSQTFSQKVDLKVKQNGINLNSTTETKQPTPSNKARLDQVSVNDDIDFTKKGALLALANQKPNELQVTQYLSTPQQTGGKQAFQTGLKKDKMSSGQNARVAVDLVTVRSQSQRDLSNESTKQQTASVTNLFNNIQPGPIPPNDLKGPTNAHGDPIMGVSGSSKLPYKALVTPPLNKKKTLGKLQSSQNLSEQTSQHNPKKSSQKLKALMDPQNCSTIMETSTLGNNTSKESVALVNPIVVPGSGHSSSVFQTLPSSIQHKKAVSVAMSKVPAAPLLDLQRTSIVIRSKAPLKPAIKETPKVKKESNDTNNNESSNNVVGIGEIPSKRIIQAKKKQAQAQQEIDKLTKPSTKQQYNVPHSSSQQPQPSEALQYMQQKSNKKFPPINNAALVGLGPTYKDDFASDTSSNRSSVLTPTKMTAAMRKTHVKNQMHISLDGQIGKSPPTLNPSQWGTTLRASIKGSLDVKGQSSQASPGPGIKPPRSGKSSKSPSAYDKKRRTVNGGPNNWIYPESSQKSRHRDSRAPDACLMNLDLANELSEPDMKLPNINRSANNFNLQPIKKVTN